jgi:hypothetical protein
MGGSTDLHVLAQVKFYGDGVNDAWRSLSDMYLWNGSSWTNDFGAALLPEKTEFRQQVRSTTTTQIAAVVAGYLIDDEVGI